MSGHNKWAQIKHKKAATDAKKGQLFSKLVKEITVAARTGGSLPESNSRLRSALLRAKEEGLPKENIERAIARATGSGAGVDLLEFLYEATAGSGIMILIEGITDSKNRTTAEIKHLLPLYNAKFSEPGSVVWNFEKVGIIRVEKEQNTRIPEEKIEEAIIESGAQDFKILDSIMIVETEFQAKEDVRKKLEQSGIVVSETGYDFIAKSLSAVPADERKQLEVLFEALLAHEDVQNIYTNIEN